MSSSPVRGHRDSKYSFAVAWIAVNDEPTEKDPVVICDQMSVVLVADMFGKEPEVVAADIMKVRESQ